MTAPAKFKPKGGDGLACNTTPREALMLALSRVDDYTSAVIVLGKVDDEGGVDTHVVTASPTVYHTVGMLSDAIKGTLQDD